MPFSLKLCLKSFITLGPVVPYRQGSQKREQLSMHDSLYETHSFTVVSWQVDVTNFTPLFSKGVDFWKQEVAYIASEYLPK